MWSILALRREPCKRIWPLAVVLAAVNGLRPSGIVMYSTQGRVTNADPGGGVGCREGWLPRHSDTRIMGLPLAAFCFDVEPVGERLVRVGAERRPGFE